MFVPQRPFLPEGSLRRALCYPLPESEYQEEELEDALRALGLNALWTEIDKQNNWYSQLSLGEIQRLAIVRTLLFKPMWLFLDEATASLDLGTQTQVYERIVEWLPNVSVCSIAHRRELGIYHHRVLGIEDKRIIER